MTIILPLSTGVTLMMMLHDAAEFNEAMADLSPNGVAKIFEARRERCEEMTDTINQAISEAHRAK